MFMNKKFLGVIFFIFAVFAFSACSNNSPETTTPDTTVPTSSDTFYTISTNEDLTYSYKVTDKKGNILFSDDHASREPTISQVDADVLCVSVQTGTGLSTSWAVFCNVDNGNVSEFFQYVLGAQNEYVFYVEYENGSPSVVVQNIFDSSSYRKAYTLQDCGAFADPVCDITFDGEGKATVTYLIGTETASTQTSTTIYFP